MIKNTSGTMGAALQIWKITHISRISNSVTHLRSFNNTIITDITETPCQYHRAEHLPHLVPMSPHQVAIDIVASNGECFSVSCL